MIDPTVEEALEKLYIRRVEERVELVAGEADEDALNRAAELGLVRREGDGYELTEPGEGAGRDVVRRHRLAECLLQQVLASGPERMDEDACTFEHVLQHGLDERVCTLLGHPSQCPHGKAIPEGACCRRAREQAIREVGPLCDGRPGDHGVVTYLATREDREVQKLMAMGILPGASIRLIQRFPSYVFQLGYSQFAVDRPLAAVIYVHWSDGPADAPAGRRRRARHGRGASDPALP